MQQHLIHKRAGIADSFNHGIGQVIILFEFAFTTVCVGCVFGRYFQARYFRRFLKTKTDAPVLQCAFQTSCWICFPFASESKIILGRARDRDFFDVKLSTLEHKGKLIHTFLVKWRISLFWCNRDVVYPQDTHHGLDRIMQVRCAIHWLKQPIHNWIQMYLSCTDS